MHTDWKTPRACDLCGGEPKCVEYCPTKILKTYNSHDFPYRRKEYAKRYLKRALKQWGIEDIISEQKWSSDGSEKT